MSNDKTSIHSQISLMSSQARGTGMGPANPYSPQQQQQHYAPDDRYPNAAAAPLSSPTSSSYQDAYLQQQQHQQQYSNRQPTQQQRDQLEQQRLHQQRLQEQMNAEDSLRMNLHHQNTHRVARPNGAGRIQDSPTGAQGGNKLPPSYYSYPPPPNDASSFNKSDDDGSAASRFRRLYQFPCSNYGKAFMGVFALEAVLVIILQSVIVAMYFKALRPDPYDFAPQGMTITPPPYLDQRNVSRSIPAYLLVFVFANLFQLVLAWDAVRAQNTIQLIAIVIFNLCCFAYSIFEIPQSRSALLDDRESKIMFFVPEKNADDLAVALKPLLIVVAVVFGLTQVVITWLAYQLFQEFGWRIYKKIGADPKKKKMYRFYQIYLVLIKVDLFFFVGFSIQFIYLTLTRQADDPEFVITILVLPLTLVILYVAIYAVRHESHMWMSAFIVSMHCGVAYFIFKVVRMFVGEKEKSYKGVRNFLTLFASLCLITILATIANAAICFRNFGKGLKPHLVKEGQEQQSASSQPGRPMVID